MMRRSCLLVCTALAISLAACTSNRPADALDSVAASVQPASAGSQAGLLNAVDPATAIARIRISPVVGAPSGAAQALATGIRSRSADHAIALMAPAAPNATHDLKGYFSAITESGMTTVIYVWDVFDPAGNRLHRIQGQEAAQGTSMDGWSSVSAATMEKIGARTMDELALWMGRGS